MRFLNILVFFRLDLGQISFNLVENVFATWQLAFLATGITFYDISIRACAEIKILSFWTRKWPTSLGFSIFGIFFALYFPSQYQWFFLSLLPFLILEIKSKSLYHKDSTTCRPLNKVEPCFAGFVPGCVTKNEYPGPCTCGNNFFFSIPFRKRYQRLRNSPTLCDVAFCISQLFVLHFAMSAFACIFTISHNRTNKQRHPSFEFFSIIFSWPLVV